MKNFFDDLEKVKQTVMPEPKEEPKDEPEDEPKEE